MKTALKDLVQVDLQKCVELFLFWTEVLFLSSLLFENKLQPPVCPGSAENSKWIILARAEADLLQMMTIIPEQTWPISHNKIGTKH